MIVETDTAVFRMCWQVWNAGLAVVIVVVVTDAEQTNEWRCAYFNTANNYRSFERRMKSRNES